jgi:septal ring factor EnvC (AmiA/AmiB activator)
LYEHGVSAKQTFDNCDALLARLVNFINSSEPYIKTRIAETTKTNEEKQTAQQVQQLNQKRQSLLEHLEQLQKDITPSGSIGLLTYTNQVSLKNISNVVQNN